MNSLTRPLLFLLLAAFRGHFIFQRGATETWKHAFSIGASSHHRAVSDCCVLHSAQSPTRDVHVPLWRISGRRGWMACHWAARGGLWLSQPLWKFISAGSKRPWYRPGSWRHLLGSSFRDQRQLLRPVSKEVPRPQDWVVPARSPIPPQWVLKAPRLGLSLHLNPQHIPRSMVLHTPHTPFLAGFAASTYTSTRSHGPDLKLTIPTLMPIPRRVYLY